MVHGSWRRLVYGQPAPADGAVDRNAYAFCVLTQFHRHLKRRDIYAPGILAVARPARAAALTARRGRTRRGRCCSALSLPENPDRLLARARSRARRRLPRRRRPARQDTEVTVDDEGRLHLGAWKRSRSPRA